MKDDIFPKAQVATNKILRKERGHVLLAQFYMPIHMKAVMLLVLSSNPNKIE